MCHVPSETEMNYNRSMFKLTITEEINKMGTLFEAEKKERLELIKSQKENVELHRTIFEIVKDQKQLIDILSKKIDLLESRIKN
jgi:uncharacterized protein YqgV (UPF0045/DUF77 family)